MPSSEVSQLKHAQGAIHFCKHAFVCYEIGKYTKNIAKCFQQCKTCVSSFYEIMQDVRCGKVMMQGAKFRQAHARQILTEWSVLQSWESPLRLCETVWDCAKCKMLNRDQRRCGLVCTQFRHIAWFKIQTKEDTVRTRWSLQPSWGASLPPASNIPVPLCPCNPIHPEPEESGAMNVDEIGRVT